MSVRQKTQSFSRLAAAMAHFENVRRVERGSSNGRAKVYVVNNGIGFREIKKLRRYGWEIAAISIRHNYITVERQGGDSA